MDIPCYMTHLAPPSPQLLMCKSGRVMTGFATPLLREPVNQTYFWPQGYHPWLQVKVMSCHLAKKTQEMGWIFENFGCILQMCLMIIHENIEHSSLKYPNYTFEIKNNEHFPSCSCWVQNDPSVVRSLVHLTDPLQGSMHTCSLSSERNIGECSSANPTISHSQDSLNMGPGLRSSWPSLFCVILITLLWGPCCYYSHFTD